MKNLITDNPMVSFNNFITKLSDELSEIFETNLVEEDSLIFDNDSILIHNCVRLRMINDKFHTRVSSIPNEMRELYRILYENASRLENILFRYLYVLNELTQNEDSVSTKTRMVKTVFDNIMQNKIHEYYIVPILEDVEIDNTKHDLIIKFRNRLDGSIEYSLRRVEPHMYETRKWNDIEVLRRDVIERDYLKEFLTNLFVHGKI